MSDVVRVAAALGLDGACPLDQLGEDGLASGEPIVGRSVDARSLQRGNAVRLADGRRGVVRAVSSRGVLEVAGPFGTVFTHVDVVERS